MAALLATMMTMALAFQSPATATATTTTMADALRAVGRPPAPAFVVPVLRTRSSSPRGAGAAVVSSLGIVGATTTISSSSISHYPHHHHRSSSSSSRRMSSSEDFDQARYTDAAWSAIAALPACADYHSATSVDAPMLLSVLLNPTRYQAGENALTARQVVVKLLEDAARQKNGGGEGGEFDVDRLRNDVEKYLERQPKVGGDVSAQKSLGRTLGEVLQAGRDVRDGLQVSEVTGTTPDRPTADWGPRYGNDEANPREDARRRDVERRTIGPGVYRHRNPKETKTKQTHLPPSPPSPPSLPPTLYYIS